ncbi:MAG TPA: hypothetical protein VH374_07155 [Polyangia bacterium]|nr:hypothetical protein [Polyangia bacterium]
MTLALTIVFGAIAFAGCRRRAATTDDCRAVLDRLVHLELAESGFRDPVLATRWTRELGRKLTPQLEGCVGKRVPIDLPACLAAARTPEEIAHRCLK